MKKLLVLAITLCLLMSMCSVGMAVSAHRHDACGVVNCTDHGHWFSPEYRPLPAGGSLTVNGYTAFHFLTQNASLDALNVINDGMLYLCLNGYTLYHDGITIQGDYSEVYLCDCKGGGKVMPKPGSNAGIDVNSGCIYLYSGTITGHKNTAIRLKCSPDFWRCSLEMLGGEISGNSGGNGGGISCLGDNTILYLYGGVIRNNTATRGGGVYADNIYFADLKDITITGNTATHGGGIYVTASPDNSSGLDLGSNLRIENNRTTGGMGGGVYVSGSVFVNVYGNNHFIFNNTSDGNACNLYMARKMLVRNEYGYRYPITAMGNSGGKIGVYVEDPVTPDEPLRFLNAYDDGSVMEENLQPFVSDQGYGIRLQDYPYEDVRSTEGVLYLPTVPATGDNTPVLLWAAMLLMAAGAAVLLRRRMAK